jgi:hypothetical protein
MSSRHGHNKLRVAAAFFVGSVAIAPGALSEVIRQRFRIYHRGDKNRLNSGFVPPAKSSKAPSVLFAEFDDQVLLLCPVKKGISGFAFVCFASSPLEAM